MIINYFVHNAVGEILRSGSCPPNCLLQQGQAGETVRQGKAMDDVQFFDLDAMTVAIKPNITAILSKVELQADGVDSIVIGELPVPAVVTLDDIEYNVNDGVFEFTVDLPGDYSIKVDALHHLPFNALVTAI